MIKNFGDSILIDKIIKATNKGVSNIFMLPIQISSNLYNVQAYGSYKDGKIINVGPVVFLTQHQIQRVIQETFIATGVDVEIY